MKARRSILADVRLRASRTPDASSLLPPRLSPCWTLRNTLSPFGRGGAIQICFAHRRESAVGRGGGAALCAFALLRCTKGCAEGLADLLHRSCTMLRPLQGSACTPPAQDHMVGPLHVRQHRHSRAARLLAPCRDHGISSLASLF
ncbi:hypothetical protein OH77DRAFT_1049216 [Trametes cingulata]|nr:hypothetical protein OH77DRAFT_1049216 [Trametes cingulata]